MATSSTGRKLRASGSKAHEMRATRGISNPAIWALEASGISTASLTLPRRASSTALPCSVAFPTIATITTATKNSERCAVSAKACSVPTSVSVTKAVTTVASPSTATAVVRGQPTASTSADERAAAGAGARNGSPPLARSGAVRQGEARARPATAVRITVEARHRDDEHDHGGECDEAERDVRRRSIDGALPADEKREAEDEQEVAGDRADKRRPHDLVSSRRRRRRSR